MTDTAERDTTLAEVAGELYGALMDARPHAEWIADLLNSEWIAPRSRTGRRWRVTGAHRGLLRLSPQLGAFSDPSSYLGGGGVKAIQRTYGDLLRWTPANEAARRVARGGGRRRRLSEQGEVNGRH